VTSSLAIKIFYTLLLILTYNILCFNYIIGPRVRVCVCVCMRVCVCVKISLQTRGESWYIKCLNNWKCFFRVILRLYTFTAVQVHGTCITAQNFSVYFFKKNHYNKACRNASMKHFTSLTKKGEQFRPLQDHCFYCYHHLHYFPLLHELDHLYHTYQDKHID